MPYSVFKRDGDPAPHLKPMTNLTAANCFDSAEFNTYWEAVSAEYYKQTHDDCACLDSGWYLEVILENYNNGWASFQAVDDIMNAEPSDAEMMSAFGTKWHDGL